MCLNYCKKFFITYLSLNDTCLLFDWSQTWTEIHTSFSMFLAYRTLVFIIFLEFYKYFPAVIIEYSAHKYH